jgi:hypothetical protein
MDPATRSTFARGRRTLATTAPEVLGSSIIKKKKQRWRLSERRKYTDRWHAYQVSPGLDAALIRSAALLALPALDPAGYAPDSHLEIANVLRRL